MAVITILPAVCSHDFTAQDLVQEADAISFLLVKAYGIWNCLVRRSFFGLMKPLIAIQVIIIK